MPRNTLFKPVVQICVDTCLEKLVYATKLYIKRKFFECKGYYVWVPRSMQRCLVPVPTYRVPGPSWRVLGGGSQVPNLRCRLWIPGAGSQMKVPRWKFPGPASRVPHKGSRNLLSKILLLLKSFKKHLWIF